MEYKVTKYTIIEQYPSILNTNIPLFDIFIGIGYYLWIILYFFYSFFKYLFKGPRFIKNYIKSFFDKKQSHKGPPTEKDFNINASSLNEEIDINSILENTNETKIIIYKGKKAQAKLKEVIQDNNFYEYISFLPIGYFILREEILIGNFHKNEIFLTKGYSIPIYNYIVFINKIKKKMSFREK